MALTAKKALAVAREEIKDVEGSTYDKGEIDEKISEIGSMGVEVVDSLPTDGILKKTIYMTPKQNEESRNVKEEWINLDGTPNGWEKIGEQEVRTATKKQIDDMIARLNDL
jgi:hypothetical protein